MHCISILGPYIVVKNQHFQSTLLRGRKPREGITKKSTLCTVSIMLTIMDDSLGDDTANEAGTLSYYSCPSLSSV